MRKIEKVTPYSLQSDEVVLASEVDENVYKTDGTFDSQAVYSSLRASLLLTSRIAFHRTSSFDKYSSSHLAIDGSVPPTYMALDELEVENPRESTPVSNSYVSSIPQAVLPLNYATLESLEGGPSSAYSTPLPFAPKSSRPDTSLAYESPSLSPPHSSNSYSSYSLAFSSPQAPSELKLSTSYTTSVSSAPAEITYQSYTSSETKPKEGDDSLGVHDYQTEAPAARERPDSSAYQTEAPAPRRGAYETEAPKSRFSLSPNISVPASQAAPMTTNQGSEYLALLLRLLFY